MRKSVRDVKSRKERRKKGGWRKKANGDKNEEGYKKIREIKGKQKGKRVETRHGEKLVGWGEGCEEGKNKIGGIKK